jgi:hypothetical protein
MGRGRREVVPWIEVKSKFIMVKQQPFYFTPWFHLIRQGAVFLLVIEDCS